MHVLVWLEQWEKEAVLLLLKYYEEGFCFLSFFSPNNKND